MSHQIVKSELFGPLIFRDECLHRLPIQGFLRRSEVNAIAVMSHCQAHARFSEGAPKSVDFLRGQILGFPLLTALREELHGLTPILLPENEGLMESAGNRHVGAEKRHRIRSR